MVTNRSRAYPRREGSGSLRDLENLYLVLKVYSCGLVAQLVRAPPCHGGGRGFESLLGRLNLGS